MIYPHQSNPLALLTIPSLNWKILTNVPLIGKSNSGLLLEMIKHTGLWLGYKRIVIPHPFIHSSQGLVTRKVCQLGTSHFSYVMLATSNSILKTAIRNYFRASQCQNFWWASEARTAPLIWLQTYHLLSFHCFIRTGSESISRNPLSKIKIGKDNKHSKSISTFL